MARLTLLKAEHGIFRVKLCSLADSSVFYDKLTLTYLEMPKYRKRLEDSESNFEEWLYLIRNLSRLGELPGAVEGQGVFSELFKTAEMASFNAEQRGDYEQSVKLERDSNLVLYSKIREAEEQAEARGLAEGEARGLEQGKAAVLAEGERKQALAMVTRLKPKGWSVEEIVELTGLSP